MSLRTEVTNSDLYHSGLPFRPREMAIHLCADQKAVAEALLALRDICAITYDGARYCKPNIHWIHKMRLANPVVGQ